MKDFIQVILALVFTVGFIFGSYWIAKKLSYEWWYEDMVKETVREMVNPHSLK